GVMEGGDVGGGRGEVLGGKYSLPFTTAVALTRDLSDPLAYDDKALWDPLVRDLATRIELIRVEAAEDTPGVWPAEILIERGSETHALRAGPYTGSPEHPLTCQDPSEKFTPYPASPPAPRP